MSALFFSSKHDKKFSIKQYLNTRLDQFEGHLTKICRDVVKEMKMGVNENCSVFYKFSSSL